MAAREAPPNRPPASAWGLAGGLLAGALDLARVAGMDRLDAGPPAIAADALVGLVPAALLGAVVGLLVGLLRPAVSRRVAFAAGFLGVLVDTGAAALGWPATPYGITAPASPFGRGPHGGVGPNVLLVTLDGARADRFEDARVTTTATNRVRVEGVGFASAWAQVPYTGPSYATLHTGRAPWDGGPWLDGVPLADDATTLAEVMAASGRDTGAFLSRGQMSRGLGFERGFRTYDDDLAWAKGAERLPLGRLWVRLQRGSPGWLEERRTGASVDRALAWLDRRQGPWFAWVQIGDALPPFAPPPPYDTRYLPEGGPIDPRNATLPPGAPAWVAARHPGVTDPDWLAGLYDGEVSAADREVARLLDWLDARGLATSTLVVVTAPNGLALGEEGRWFRHDGLTEAEVRVPWVARWPGHLPAATLVNDPVELADVGPTMLEWLALPAPPSWTGASAADLVAGGPAARAVARSVAFDPEESTGGPWRMAAVRTRNDQWIHRERPGATDVFGGGPPEAGDAERALLADLLAERARDLLRGWDAASVEAPRLSPAAERWLADQGATLRP